MTKQEAALVFMVLINVVCASPGNYFPRTIFLYGCSFSNFVLNMLKLINLKERRVATMLADFL